MAEQLAYKLNIAFQVNLIEAYINSGKLAKC